MRCQLLAILASSAIVLGQDPAQLPLADNKADLVGTWVSTSQSVITGPSFINPINFTFHNPKLTGISYSFTDDGHFEESFYTLTVNATMPNCITAVLQWQHGSYQALANNSILYFPIASDGRQRVLNTCSPQSDVTQQFNQTFWMRGWEIVQDPLLGAELQLYEFDGTPVNPLYPYANPPIMLPTETLTPSTNIGLEDFSSAMRRVASPVLIGVAGLLFGTVSVLRLL